MFGGTILKGQNNFAKLDNMSTKETMMLLAGNYVLILTKVIFDMWAFIRFSLRIRPPKKHAIACFFVLCHIRFGYLSNVGINKKHPNID